MTKTYFSPMLQIVSINKHDIITTSGGVETGSGLGNVFNESDVSYAPDRFDWDGGY